jgi:hypothetical protein
VERAEAVPVEELDAHAVVLSRAAVRAAFSNHHCMNAMGAVRFMRCPITVIQATAAARVTRHLDSARIFSTRFIGAIGGRCIGTIGMVHPDTLFIVDSGAFL